MTLVFLCTRMDYIQESNEGLIFFFSSFSVKYGLRSCLHCIIQTLLWSHLFRLLCGAHDYISWMAMPLVLQLPITYDCNIILISHWVAKAPRLRTTDLGNSLSGMTLTWLFCLLTLLGSHVPKAAVHQHHLLCHLGSSYHQVSKAHFREMGKVISQHC